VSRPHAPSTDSINSWGTNRRGSIKGPRFAGVSIGGSHWPFDLCAPSHRFAKRMTIGPVRALRLPVAGRCLLVGPCGFPWTHRRDASNPFLQPTFRVTSTRSKNTLFGDFPPSRRGKTRRRSPSRSSASTALPPLFAEDAGPPRGHPASNSPVLDGTLPASGREAAAPRFRAARGERSSFFGCLTLRRSNPLTPPGQGEEERANAQLPLLSPLPWAARQCCPLSRARGAFRRRSPGRAPSRAPGWSSAPVGRRAQVLHVFIDVRKLRLDLPRAALAGGSWPHALLTTSADRCFNEHDSGPLEHPGPAESVAGTAAVSIDRCLSIEDRPPKVRRVRGRESPSLGVPSRDCSRKRLRPNPDRFRHLVSRVLLAALSGVDEGDGRDRQRCTR